MFLGTVFMTGGASYGAYQSAHNGYSIYEGSMDYLDQTYENSNHLLLCDDFLARIDSMAILNDSITVVNDSLFAYAGALHNDILESILPQNNANINSIILPPIIDPINISPTINNYGCALLSDQETIDSLIMITDDMSYLYDYDIDEQLDYNEDKGDISSNTKTVLSLFFDAYFGYANSLNDVNNIVSYYHDIVSSSNELTQTEKICILMYIEITKYSYSFWQDYGLQ